MRSWKSLIDEDSPMMVDSNNIESKVVKIAATQNFAKEVLGSMASQGLHGFIRAMLLMMERIYDKLTRIGVVYFDINKTLWY
jgi:hypothetical protein